MSDFRMPALGADMEAGTLVEWLVRPGDRVKKGDVIAVVETQKGAIEVEIFDEGIVSEIIAPVGTQVQVGGLLAHIGERRSEPREEPAPAKPPRQAPLPQPTAAPAPQGRVEVVSLGGKITPAARRRAGELGMDTTNVPGTGVENAVTLADVEAAAAARSPETAAAAVLPPGAVPRRSGFDPAEMRKAIAVAMGRSKREIPHYYLSHTIDLAAALHWLETYNRAQPVPHRLLP
ncbi:MAG: biotin/lipoyl-binding protein, partial [Alphaproteobacteria bacterium]|nr:biotin/lipoyl-binding protein [Alphaproteobacteria bacterium]